jgi:hypothetical protein
MKLLLREKGRKCKFTISRRSGSDHIIQIMPRKSYLRQIERLSEHL